MPRQFSQSIFLTTIFLTASLIATEAIAGPRVDIVIGEKAAALEKLAADELANQLKRVYEADVKIGSTAPADTPHVIFVGSPDTNANMKPFSNSWPSGDKKLTDQGHLLRSVTHNKRPALLIGGGSPVATYWAVAEFGHRLGIRAMFFGDLDPVSPPEVQLGGIDVVLEPVYRVRGWEFVHADPMTAGAWGVGEYRQVLQQLAKRKFNHIRLYLFAGEPWVQVEFGGVKSQSAALWDGQKFPVSGDTLGRKPFIGAKFFENPDFAGTASPADRLAAGKKWLTGVIDAAHEFGIAVTCEVPMYEFPLDFQSLAKPAYRREPGYLRYSVDFGTQAKDRNVVGVAQAQWRAYRETYPNVDAFEIRGFWDPDERKLLRRLIGEVEASFGQRDRRPILRTLQRRNDVIVSAPFDLNSESNDNTSGIAEVRIGRPGFYLPSIAPSKIADDLEAALQQARDGYWAGGAYLGDADLPAYCLSRAGFGEPISPETTLRQFLDPFCGEGIHERVALALHASETALSMIEASRDPLGFTVGMNMKASFPTFLKSQVNAPESWAKIQEQYLNAMNEMYRANTRAREGGRAFLLYFARRFEFAYEYMGAITAARNAGAAEWQMNYDKVIPNLETAIESLNNGLNAMAAVARSNSDRGLIAVLNEYGYRPIKKTLAEVQEAK